MWLSFFLSKLATVFLKTVYFPQFKHFICFLYTIVNKIWVYLSKLFKTTLNNWSSLLQSCTWNSSTPRLPRGPRKYLPAVFHVNEASHLLMADYQIWKIIIEIKVWVSLITLSWCKTETNFVTLQIWIGSFSLSSPAALLPELITLYISHWSGNSSGIWEPDSLKKAL